MEKEKEEDENEREVKGKVEFEGIFLQGMYYMHR